MGSKLKNFGSLEYKPKISHSYIQQKSIELLASSQELLGMFKRWYFILLPEISLFSSQPALYSKWLQKNLPHFVQHDFSFYPVDLLFEHITRLGCLYVTALTLMHESKGIRGTLELMPKKCKYIQFLNELFLCVSSKCHIFCSLLQLQQECLSWKLSWINSHCILTLDV